MFLYILIFFISLLLYYSSFISQAYNTIYVNYKRLKLLETTTPGLEVSVVNITKSSLKMCFSLLFLYFSQNWEKSVKNIGFNHYEITYAIRGRVYKLRVRPTKLPKILQVIDENDDDVTDKLSPYFGPDENFHGKVYRVRDFKYKELSFNMADGNTYEFREDDDIVLRKR